MLDPNLEAKPVDLKGKRFALVPLAPPYHRALYNLSIAQQVAFRWRFHGTIPPFEVFEQTLNANVLVQFVVTPLNDQSRVAGHVVAYNANLQDRYVYIGAIHDPQVGAGALEGLILLVRYLFAHWQFRKLYVEAPEFNSGQFRSGIRMGLLREESRLLSHRYYDGQFWDFITWAIYPENAQSFADDHPGLLADDGQQS